MTETELMPNLSGDYTELGGSKVKKGKGFSKPNSEPGPKRELAGRNRICWLASFCLTLLKN